MLSTIGVSLWSIEPLSFNENRTVEEIIDIIGNLGVDSIDFIHDYLYCHPHANIYKLKALKKRTEAAGLKTLSLWFRTDIVAAIYAASFKEAIDNFNEYIAISADFGTKYLTCPFLNNTPGVSIEKSKEVLLRFFEHVLPVAEEYNVVIGHEIARQGTPEASLWLNNKLKSPYYTPCPDFEAWRLVTDDISFDHVEKTDSNNHQPTSIELFKDCLKHAKVMHAKLLSFDANGEEPHFPIAEMMEAVNATGKGYHFSIEYEGWIPDIKPELNCIEETKKGVDLLKRYLK